jgi:hypothetical protein
MLTGVARVWSPASSFTAARLRRRSQSTFQWVPGSVEWLTGCAATRGRRRRSRGSSGSTKSTARSSWRRGGGVDLQELDLAVARLCKKPHKWHQRMQKSIGKKGVTERGLGENHRRRNRRNGGGGRGELRRAFSAA